MTHANLPTFSPTTLRSCCRWSNSLPMVELVESAQLSLQDLITRLGRATIEAVLQISATGVAGESHQGKAGGEIVRHGRQSGVVPLTDRKVQVSRPRLRKRGGGAEAEVGIPAYA